MSNEKPEALELADIFENLAHPTGTRYRAAAELRRQHARIQELEAMLESIGAGGVSAQRITQGKDHFAQDSKMVAAQEPFGYFKAEPFGWRDCAETDEGAIALYEAPQPQADALDAERWRFIKRKLCLTGNGDGACAMQALNLPARIIGWPDVGELAIAQSLDAAIDAAIAAAKENK